MAATPRAPGASAAWQRRSCTGGSWGIRGVPDTDRTDPAACYLVTARTEVSKTAPYRLHTAYLILEKSKSECKIHFSLIAVQEPYGAYTGSTEKPRGRKRRNQIVEIDGQTTARTGLRGSVARSGSCALSVNGPKLPPRPNARPDAPRTFFAAHCDPV